MDCPDCGAPVVAFAVPEELRSYAPAGGAAAALCRRCLALHPAEEGDAVVDPDLTRVSDAFPESPETAVPMALVVGLLDSLALYREELRALLARVERAGTDPLLVIDRLAADAALDPAVDLDRRRTQLEQLY